MKRKIIVVVAVVVLFALVVALLFGGSEEKKYRVVDEEPEPFTVETYEVESTEEKVTVPETSLEDMVTEPETSTEAESSTEVLDTLVYETNGYGYITDVAPEVMETYESTDAVINESVMRQAQEEEDLRSSVFKDVE